MVDLLTLLFRVLALVTLVAVPAWAWYVRGRPYAIFGLVILAIALPGALVTEARLVGWIPGTLAPWIAAAYAYGMAASGLHLAALVRARLRPTIFRWSISIPGMAFIAGGALSGLWLLALLPVRGLLAGLGWSGALEALQPFDLLPLAVVALSIVTSTRTVGEIVRVPLGQEGPPALTRLPVERYRRRPPAPLPTRPLRVVQISDPHLGPWQPIAKLRRRLETLLAHDPDLVLLTGDFLTMESAGTPGALAEAFAPLRAFAGRSFAILGNHDLESEAEVRSALAASGVHLLVDEEAIVDTASGAVQIVGAAWAWRNRREHLDGLLARFPRRPDHVRLLLLHDPSAFHHVAPGDVDLTLSGHTHGGQLGLVSLGIAWTVLSGSRWPDHGLFGHGGSRLYVHRGTGFYGFPLRVGVPGEASLLEVVR